MAKEQDLKLQRDRFLAFSFAGADLLIEVDRGGKIRFTSGATKFLTGSETQAFEGRDCRDLFSPNDIYLLGTMIEKARPGLRQGPYLVTIKNLRDESATNKVFISGFMLEPDGNIYLSISRGDTLLRILRFDQDQNDSKKKIVSSAKDMENILSKKIPELISSGKDADVSFLELKTNKLKVKDQDWQAFTSNIAQFVMEASVDGEMAADLGNGRYMLVQDGNTDTEALQSKIMDMARHYKIDDLINLKAKKIEGDLPNLSAREATRAIMYTMNKMEKQGLDKCGDDLKESFKSYLEENTNKIKNLKNIISHQKFHIHFQPIVNLQSNEVAHHEVLMRFDGAQSPYELIVLGEDVGISPDIDLSVCRQTIKYLDQHKANNIGTVAVNLSGSSIQNEAFFTALMSALHEYPDAARHIAFEITESSNIKELDLVDAFIQKLRDEGHQIFLDDFGAGAASFQYLHKLRVDGVKIDGAYTKTILTSPRDATLIRNLTKMCHELDTFVVAEMVETKEQANYLRDIGIDKGQGWYFSKAAADPLPLGPIKRK